jgi:hypothetical protein
MTTSIPPRLRSATIMAVGGAIILVVVGAIHGWSAVGYIAPVVVLMVGGYYVWAGRDSDSAAVIRHETDERQTTIRLHVQALIGRVMSAAAALGYVVALIIHAPLWPFATFVLLPATTFLIGWLKYSDAMTLPMSESE